MCSTPTTCSPTAGRDETWSAAEGEPIDRILGIAAHEIKNALGPLAMTLQLCERRAAAGDPVGQWDAAKRASEASW